MESRRTHQARVLLLASLMIVFLFMSEVQCLKSKNGSMSVSYMFNFHDVDDHADSHHEPENYPMDDEIQDDDIVDGHKDYLNDANLESPSVVTCAEYFAPKSSAGDNSTKRWISKKTGRIQNTTDYNYTMVQCQPRWHCFVLGMTDPENSSRYEIKRLGCWMVSDDQDKCEKETCMANVVSRSPNTFFCCCNGHMCNTHFVEVHTQEEPTTTTSALLSSTVGPLVDSGYRVRTIIIALVSVISVSMLVVLAYLPYRLWWASRCRIGRSAHHSGSGGNGSGDYGAGGCGSGDQSGAYMPVADLDWDSLKFDEVLARGQFSEVWKGTFGTDEVAIKVYSPKYKQYYYNECDCYTLPFMGQENLVKFHGAREQGQAGSTLHQYILVLDYHPLGSLTNYFKQHTIDWTLLFSMGQDIAKGLVHLHTDITSGGLFKPSLAHRDINTRNILVTSDLRCLVTDLGFCTAVMGSKLLKNGVPEAREQASLAEVGTIRYLAPEVFDGAVNLRDCEASLKQVDVYSLGLVLWEVASRCVDLYQGAPMPEYQLPYQAEAGLHPSFVDIQSLVVRYKTRPKFPEVWKDTNPAVRSLKETIEDCWDSDPEARLTSLCVQERFSDMATLWAQGTRNRGFTPTLNTTKNLPGGHHSTTSPGAFVSNGMAFLPEFVDREVINSNIKDHSSECYQSRALIGCTSSSDSAVKDPIVSNAVVNEHFDDRGNSVTCPLISSHSQSVIDNGTHTTDSRYNRQSLARHPSISGSTVDTWLPSTPSGEERDMSVSDTFSSSSAVSHQNTTSSSSGMSAGLKANNVMLAMNNTVLHPHQGRNPTVERNTHKCSDEELTVSGNQLIGPDMEAMLLFMKSNTTRSDNTCVNADPGRNLYGHTSMNVYDSSDTSGLGDSSSLVQHDSLNHQHQHRNAPIPYLQNQVHGQATPNTNFSTTAGTATTSRPKQANVSYNDNSSATCSLHSTPTQSPPQSYPEHQPPDRDNQNTLKHKLRKLMTNPRHFSSKISHLMFKLNKYKPQQNTYSPAPNQNVELGTPRPKYQHHNHHVSNSSTPTNPDLERSTKSGGETLTEYVNGGLETTPTHPTPHGPSNHSSMEMKPTYVNIVNGFAITTVCATPDNKNGNDTTNNPTVEPNLPSSSLISTSSNPHFRTSPTPQTHTGQLSVMVPTVNRTRKMPQDSLSQSISFQPCDSLGNGVSQEIVHSLTDTEISTSFNSDDFLPDRHDSILEAEDSEPNPHPSHSSTLSPSSVNISSSTSAVTGSDPVTNENNIIINMCHFNKFDPHCNITSSKHRDKNDNSVFQEKDKLTKKDNHINSVLVSQSIVDRSSPLSNSNTTCYPVRTPFNFISVNSMEEQQPDHSIMNHTKEDVTVKPSPYFIPIQQSNNDSSLISSSASSVVIPQSNYTVDLHCPWMEKSSQQLNDQPAMLNGQHVSDNLHSASEVKQENSDSNKNELPKNDVPKVGNSNIICCTNGACSSNQKSRPQSLPIQGHRYNNGKDDSVKQKLGAEISKNGNNVKAVNSNGIGQNDMTAEMEGNYPIKVPTVSLDKLPQSVFKTPITNTTMGTNSTPNPTSTIPTTNSTSGSSQGTRRSKVRNVSGGHKSDSVRSISLKEGHQPADSSEKIRRRIKTPVSFKNARLSLYDDRLMSRSMEQPKSLSSSSSSSLSEVVGDGTSTSIHSGTTSNNGVDMMTQSLCGDSGPVNGYKRGNVLMNGEVGENNKGSTRLVGFESNSLLRDKGGRDVGGRAEVGKKSGSANNDMKMVLSTSELVV